MTKKRKSKLKDSPYSIAREEYGDQSFWREVVLVNGLNIFQELGVGTDLEIPTLEQMSKIKSTAESVIKTVGTLTSSSEELDLSALKTAATSAFSLIDWIY